MSVPDKSLGPYEENKQMKKGLGGVAQVEDTSLAGLRP
jgi:hypothetical protein